MAVAVGVTAASILNDVQTAVQNGRKWDGDGHAFTADAPSMTLLTTPLSVFRSDSKTGSGDNHLKHTHSAHISKKQNNLHAFRATRLCRATMMMMATANWHWSDNDRYITFDYALCNTSQVHANCKKETNLYRNANANKFKSKLCTGIEEEEEEEEEEDDNDDKATKIWTFRPFFGKNLTQLHSNQTEKKKTLLRNSLSAHRLDNVQLVNVLPKWHSRYFTFEQIRNLKRSKQTWIKFLNYITQVGFRVDIMIKDLIKKINLSINLWNWKFRILYFLRQNRKAKSLKNSLYRPETMRLMLNDKTSKKRSQHHKSLLCESKRTSNLSQTLKRSLLFYFHTHKHTKKANRACFPFFVSSKTKIFALAKATWFQYSRISVHNLRL